MSASVTTVGNRDWLNRFRHRHPRCRVARWVVAYGVLLALLSGWGLVERVTASIEPAVSFTRHQLAAGLILAGVITGLGLLLARVGSWVVFWLAIGLIAATMAALTLAACVTCAGAAPIGPADLPLLAAMLLATGLLFSKLARLRWQTRHR